MSVVLAVLWLFGYCTYVAAPLDLSAWAQVCRLVM